MAMIDFPSAPTSGQEVTLAGVTYKWNGQGWLVVGSGSANFVADTPPANPTQGSFWFESDTMILWMWYVDGTSSQWIQVNGTPTGNFVIKTGDTMTGQLTLERPAGAFTNNILGTKAGKNRWNLELGDGSAEAGSNGGSAFRISSYDDAGVAQGSAFSIDRTGGRAVFINTQTFQMMANSPNLHLVDTSPNGVRLAVYQNNFVTWVWDFDSGATTGRNFILRSYNDAGAQTATPLQIARGNGTITFGAPLYLITSANRWQIDGIFVIGGLGYQPGGGVWADSSDSRIKNVQGDYTQGLEAVKALRPVRYTFKGNYSSKAPEEGVEVVADHSAVLEKEFIGLVAQEAETSMPEMVTQVAGYIDGAPVDDARILNASALTYALVNAVKELAARVEALETPQ